MSGSTRWPRAFLRSALSAARGSASGRRTGRMAADPVRHRRQGWSSSPSIQPIGFSELDYALAKAGCVALVTATAFKTSQLRRDAQRAAAGACQSDTAGHLHAARLPSCVRDPDRRHTVPGHHTVRRCPPDGRPAPARGGSRRWPQRCSSTTPSTSSSPPARRARQRADANASQHAQQRLFFCRAMCADREDRLCIPVPLYHCFGMVMGNLASSRTAPPWSTPARASIRWRRCRPSRRNDARRSTACRPCSSPT